MIPVECIEVERDDVTQEPRLLRLLRKLGEQRGDIVMLIPPVRGGWKVQVGTTNLGSQGGGLEAAIEVTAQKLGITGPGHCARCDAIMHMEAGKLRCRNCP